MRVQRSLEQIAVGRGGTVLRVDAHDARTRQRLMEMGLTPGVRVTVKRVAPLGDPIEIELRGYRLSLRREDARSIAVLPGMQERSGDGAARARETGLPIAKNGALAQGLTEQALGCTYTKTSCCGKCGGCGSAEPSEQTERNGARLAIAGNPNCGKTTLFNALTGARETVGNWPGVTVERKEGRAAAGRYDLTLVDLPGVYSLTANSTEETVAREYLLSGQADAVLIVADAVNLERNLYLTLQIASLGSPAVLALNMMDEAASQGLRIDCAPCWTARPAGRSRQRPDGTGAGSADRLPCARARLCAKRPVERSAASLPAERRSGTTVCGDGTSDRRGGGAKRYSGRMGGGAAAAGNSRGRSAPGNAAR